VLLLAFLGGVLAVASPCVLPIAPFVFARADRPFARAGAPMLAGLALMFTLVISAATASAAWIAAADDAGRVAAMLLLAFVGVSLLVPGVAERATRPLVAAGARVDSWASSRGAKVVGEAGSNLVIGVALALLWAPCAGPILGLVVTTAALRGPSAAGGWLALSFSLGAVAALGATMAASARLLARFKNWLGPERRVRQTLGALTIASVLVVATGADRSLYARGEIPAVARFERSVVAAIAPPRDNRPSPGIGLPVETIAAHARLEDRGALPDFGGGSAWINSAPLTPEALRGKVVLVWFWTFQCYNCLNALPHVKALDAKYRDKGLVVIGVHTPELPRERVEANVRAAVKELGITYPVVIDDKYTIWNRWANQYWPAAYYVDKAGRVRFHHFGEGSYDEQETVVQQLLAQP
jgi:cytochrome c biogenesis protein CcdA/thiol-disulfide isomerase/thioredoxin